MVSTDQEVAVTQPSGAAFAGRSRLSRRCPTSARSAICAVERLRQPLAAALEPTAMRRSSESLLRTFLGDGPADAVLAGAIRRGDRRHIDAAILFCDLRGFTVMSERLDEADLFAALDQYFEAVVEAVRGGGGDVLKFLGDGVLAIFPVEAAAPTRAALRSRPLPRPGNASPKPRPPTARPLRSSPPCT
jgi:class 3 adenylate cyclase